MEIFFLIFAVALALIANFEKNKVYERNDNESEKVTSGRGGQNYNDVQQSNLIHVDDLHIEDTMQKVINEMIKSPWFENIRWMYSTGSSLKECKEKIYSDAKVWAKGVIYPWDHYNYNLAVIALFEEPGLEPEDVEEYESINKKEIANYSDR